MQILFQQRFATGVLLLFGVAMPRLLLAQSADTLRLSVPQAEKLFLQNNLTLLAGQYNVNAAEALVQQAKVWDNPTLITDQNLFDGKFFRHTKEGGQQYGQVYVQVQQLIRTAGKIKKQTVLAQDNVQSAEAQFADVMRNLKYALTTDLNNLAQLQSTASVLQSNLQNVQVLSKGMDELLKVGNVSQKDNIRIKALLFSLQADYNDNLRQQFDIEKELATLLQLNNGQWVVADAAAPLNEAAVQAIPLTLLQDSALLRRPDLRLAQSQTLYQQHNIALQKALAKPDLTVGLEYDKASNYVPNYYGLALSLPLPVFNRNRGNIAAAQFTYKQNQVSALQLQKQVGNEVAAAWQKLRNLITLLNAGNTAFTASYETLLKNMVASYRQRQVSLIEFIDFISAYRDTRLRQSQLVASQRNAAAELNYTVNQTVVPL